MKHLSSKIFKVKIEYNNEVDEILITDQNPLLTELEERSILIKSNCRQGHCGMCSAVLLKGQVEHNQVLFPLKNNEILLCNSKPISDIHIKINS